MSKTREKVEGASNPFLTGKADSLWEHLSKDGKPVTKEALANRIKALKDKSKK